MQNSRSHRGISLVEAVVSVTVLALLTASFTWSTVCLSKKRGVQREGDYLSGNQYELSLFAEAGITNMVLTAIDGQPTSYPNSTDSARGRVSSESGTWQWESSQKVIGQLQPDSYLMQSENMVGVADRFTTVQFDSINKRLTVTYNYCPVGVPVSGVAGSCQGTLKERSFSLSHVTEVRLTDLLTDSQPASPTHGLILWVRSDDEWRSFNAGTQRS